MSWNRFMTPCPIMVRSSLFAFPSAFGSRCTISGHARPRRFESLLVILPTIRCRLRRLVQRPAEPPGPLPGAPADPQGFLIGFLIMVVYLFVPGLILLFRPRGNRPLDILDILAILAVWFP